MNNILTGWLIVSSTVAFANDTTLLLDASCKITCVTVLKTKSVENPKFLDYAKDTFYLDFVAKSRSEIDLFFGSPSSKKKFCTEKMEIKYGENIYDLNEINESGTYCLYFKH